MCGLYFTNELNIRDDTEMILRLRGDDEYNSVSHLNSRLYHSRLSITGVENGSQPFVDNHIISMVNGQIYNYKKLIKDYKLNANTSSDCEVLHLLYLKFGERAFSLIEGMYAFILLDKRTSTVYFGRDIIGEKPLYFSLINQKLNVASQLSMFSKMSGAKICREGIKESLLLQFNRNHTAMENVFPAKPGTIYKFDQLTMALNEIVQPPSINQKCKISNQDFAERFRDILLNSSKAIFCQGDFKPILTLSAGLDSSLLLCIANILEIDIDAATVGFHKDSSIDESFLASSFAAKYGVKTRKYLYHENVLRENWSESVLARDSLTSDATGTTLFCFYRDLSHAGYKIILSGIGGDELTLDYPWVSRMCGHVNFDDSRGVKSILADTISTALARHLTDMWAGRKYFLNLIQTFGYKYAVSLLQSDRETKVHDELLYGYLTNNGLLQTDSLTLANQTEGRTPLCSADMIKLFNTYTCDILTQKNPKKLLYQQSFPELFLRYPVQIKKSGFRTPLSNSSYSNQKFFESHIRDEIFDVLEIKRPKRVSPPVARHLAHCSVQLQKWGLF
jgi:asparagine synthase (glutamine-hydrolysing)